ncbi:hypothetical protein IWW46_006095 [Coemansia sp. RSA 2440]|nr:hypothetical protein IWW46_006095 [Coemansia sp. RSA 2440]
MSDTEASATMPNAAPSTTRTANAMELTNTPQSGTPSSLMIHHLFEQEVEAFTGDLKGPTTSGVLAASGVLA